MGQPTANGSGQAAAMMVEVATWGKKRLSTLDNLFTIAACDCAMQLYEAEDMRNRSGGKT
jgi:hypothetical protein